MKAMRRRGCAPRMGQYSLNISHGWPVSKQVNCGQGCVRCYKHRARPVGFKQLAVSDWPECLFGFLLLYWFLLLVVTRFPAVGDLGQELADVFDFLVTPDAKLPASDIEYGRCGYLPSRDIPLYR